MVNRASSLDAKIDDNEDNSTLMDTVPNRESPEADAEVLKEAESQVINTLLNCLTEREHDVIRMYFGIGCMERTLEEIGNMFGVTNERARQLKNGAIRKLKSRANQLKKLL